MSKQHEDFLLDLLVLCRKHRVGLRGVCLSEGGIGSDIEIITHEVGDQPEIKLEDLETYQDFFNGEVDGEYFISSINYKRN